MPLAERVSDTVGEWKQDLRETVERLKDEAAGLKDRLKKVLATRSRGSEVAVRDEPRRGGPPWSGSEAMRSWMRELPRLARDRPLSLLAEASWPRIDIRETSRGCRVTAELPGMDEDEVDLSLGENSLTIRGEKRVENDRSQNDLVTRELFHESFHRRIPLPFPVDQSRVKARLRRGLLTVELPRMKGAGDRTKRIPIEVI